MNIGPVRGAFVSSNFLAGLSFVTDFATQWRYQLPSSQRISSVYLSRRPSPPPGLRLRFSVAFVSCMPVSVEIPHVEIDSVKRSEVEHHGMKGGSSWIMDWFYCTPHSPHGMTDSSVMGQLSFRPRRRRRVAKVIRSLRQH